jgi:DNA processing protein
MTTRDLVALSLLPSGRRRAAAALAAAPVSLLESPDALELLVAFCAPGEPDPGARARRLRDDAGRILAEGAGRNLKVLTFFDAAYPELVREIPDAPAVLWLLGDPGRLSRRAIAIVGSRAASPYGLAVAERLGHDLARAGLVVVSGLARGCDAAAHRGALAAGGVTVAVLGSGADVVYPPEHEALYRAIAHEGAVVSELAPGTPPIAAHFPQRNRLISGLSRAVVVVEASEKSGSLITARTALEQGRDVMAVPGSVLGPRARGCHALLRDGARLVETAADVLEELGMIGADARSDEASGSAPDPVLAHLAPGEDCDLDTLAARTGLAAPDLLSRLLALELDGRLARAPGGRFVRR